MNINQLYFTRRGNQEQSAGYEIVGESVGTSSLAKEYFKGLMSQSIVKRSEFAKAYPIKIFNIASDKNYSYISNINYSYSSGNQIRTNAFAHGYVLQKNDFLELCKYPEKIAGICQENFIDGVDNPKIKQKLGEVSSLSYSETYDLVSICNKYGISKECYENIIKAVYSVILTPKASLAIRVDADIEQFKEIARELLYCIYLGLPYDIRTEITVSSYVNENFLIYFTKEVVGNYYIDIQTGEMNIPDILLSNYNFINYFIYHTFTLESIQKSEQLNRGIEQLWGNSHNKITLDMIELVYNICMQKDIQNNYARRLEQALEAECINYQYVDEYCALLVWKMIDNNDEFTSLQIKKLEERYLKTSSIQLREAYCNVFILKYCRTLTEESFAVLYRISKQNKEDYDVIIHKLEECNLTFLSRYYCTYYFERVVGDFLDLRKIWDQLPEISRTESVVDWLKNKTSSYYKQAQKNATGNERLLSNYHMYTEFLESRVVGDDLRREKENYAEIYWENFRIGEFSYYDIDKYLNTGLNNIKSNNCLIVKALKELTEEFSNGSQKGLDLFESYLMHDINIRDAVVRDKLIKEVENYCRDMNKALRFNLDFGLALSYSNKENAISMRNCWNLLKRHRGAIEVSERDFSESIRNSYILNRNYLLKEQVKNAAHEYIKDKKKMKNMPPDYKRFLELIDRVYYPKPEKYISVTQDNELYIRRINQKLMLTTAVAMILIIGFHTLPDEHEVITKIGFTVMAGVLLIGTIFALIFVNFTDNIKIWDVNVEGFEWGYVLLVFLMNIVLLTITFWATSISQRCVLMVAVISLLLVNIVLEVKDTIFS